MKLLEKQEFEKSITLLTKKLEELERKLDRNYGDSLKEYLRSDEVMCLLKVSPSTLSLWVSKRILPSGKLGGVLYFRVKDVREVLETAIRKGTKGAENTSKKGT